MKRIIIGAQIISTFLLLFSKYFLAIDNIRGWWFAVLGYIMVAFYNSKRDLKIYTLVGISLTLLTAYGGYKWAIGKSDLGIFDYLVAIGTIVFAIIMGIQSWKKYKKEKRGREKNPLWIYQVVGTTDFMGTFLLLGWHIHEGWWGMLFGHIINTYVYSRSKSYWYVALQIVSSYIALAKLFNLPLPFLQ